MSRRCARDWAVLDRVGCTPALDEGDALFYKGDVRHQTQDTLNDREAFSFDVGRVHGGTGHDFDVRKHGGGSFHEDL